MKQIKVYITPEQWAEKRLQVCVALNVPFDEGIDQFIEQCGFELIESETKPDENNNNFTYGGTALLSENNEIPTDKVEAVKYFLNQLPSGYKERALAQVDEDFIKEESDIILRPHQALAFFCDWEKTKEGDRFWRAVTEHYFQPSVNPMLPSLPNDDKTALKQWTGYFTDKGERVYLNGEYEHGGVKLKVQIKGGEYFCVREDGFPHPINHIFNYHKP